MQTKNKIDIIFGAIPAAIVAVAAAPLCSVLTVALFFGFLEALIQGRILSALGTLVWVPMFPVAFVGAGSLNYIVFMGMDKFQALRKFQKIILIASLILSIPYAVVGGVWLYQMPLKDTPLKYLAVIFLFSAMAIDIRQLFLIFTYKRDPS